MKQTAIIIPCYNEEIRLGPDEFLSFLKTSKKINFFFVNDGSKDKTLDILNQMAKKSSQFHVVDLQKNQGKAFAVYSGFNTALKDDYEYIGFWDADLATPLKMIPKFVELLNSGSFNSVFGCRIQRLGSNIKRKNFRHFQGRLFATLVSQILKLHVYDTQCGAKIFRNTKDLKKAFSEKFTTKWIFDVELIARLQKISKTRKVNFEETVYEYPLEEWHDVDGSKIKFHDGIVAFWDLLKIKMRK
jgi:glycosyltransferase involved in cell wall biosynthesis